MKTKLLALLLLVGSSAFARTHFYIGVGVGPAYGGYYVAPPPPPPPAVAYVAPAPGPGSTWIAGYWYPYRGRYVWRAGYWARRPYAGAVWVGPRYYGHRYYHGYWRR
jgi:hypothetical protein